MGANLGATGDMKAEAAVIRDARIAIFIFYLSVSANFQQREQERREKQGSANCKAHGVYSVSTLQQLLGAGFSETATAQVT